MALTKIENQNSYNQDIISALFTAATTRNEQVIDALLKIQGISLNIVNENGKSFIAEWCEANNSQSSHIKVMENWIASGQIDLTFEFQGLDIIKWCIRNTISFNRYNSYYTKQYLLLVQKIIQFLPMDNESLKRYSALLCDAVQNETTIGIAKAILSIPGIDISQKDVNNKDAFQTALQSNNAPAIILLTEVLNLFKDKPSQLISNSPLNNLLATLKVEILKCYTLLSKNNSSKHLEELLVQINIQSLYLFEESGNYPNNFSELLFALSNNLASINEGQFQDAAYNLRQVAADLGHVRAQDIIKNFPKKKTETAEKLIVQSESKEEIKTTINSAPSSKAKSSYKFFRHFKFSSKDKDLINTEALNNLNG